MYILILNSFQVQRSIILSNKSIMKICNKMEETMNFYFSSIKKFNIKNIVFLSLDYKGYKISNKILPNAIFSAANLTVVEHIYYSTPLILESSLY